MKSLCAGRSQLVWMLGLVLCIGAVKAAGEEPAGKETDSAATAKGEDASRTGGWQDNLKAVQGHLQEAGKQVGESLARMKQAFDREFDQEDLKRRLNETRSAIEESAVATKLREAAERARLEERMKEVETELRKLQERLEQVWKDGQESGEADDADRIEVWLEENGAVRLRGDGGQVLELKDLTDQVRERISAGSGVTVIIESSRQVPFERVIAVIKAAREGGAEKIQLATRKGGEGE